MTTTEIVFAVGEFVSASPTPAQNEIELHNNK
jgi:hypothetical protein